MKKTFVFITFLIFISKIILANGAAFHPGLNGKNIVPYNIRGVQLFSESIDIYKQKTICKFILKNLNKKDVSFQMGFPFIFKTGTYSSENMRTEIDKEVKMLDFKVKSADENTPVEIKINEPTEKIGDVVYDVVALWSEKMKDSQEITIICEYNTIWDYSEGWSNERSYSTTYVRETAKYWEENIMQANFYIHLDSLDDKRFPDDWSVLSENTEVRKDFRKPFMTISPEGYYINIKEKRIEWRECNIKEMSNIYFKYGLRSNCSGEMLLNGMYSNTIEFLQRCKTFNEKMKQRVEGVFETKMEKPEDASNFINMLIICMGEAGEKYYPEKWEQRIFFRLIRNYYYAIHGKKFTDKKLNEFYDKVLKPEEIIKGDLTDIEKNNVEKIQEYEDKYLYNFDGPVSSTAKSQ